MEARNPLYTRETHKQIGELNRLGWYHSIELPDGQVIEETLAAWKDGKTYPGTAQFK